MLNKIKNRKQEGFTIIEVLIVLAIAGLIMLIVFLAVPALQRNSRNTQRTNDASRVSAAVTECLNNNNGSVTTCSVASLGTAAGIGAYITIADNQQLTTQGAPSVSAFQMAYGNKCNPQGTAAAGGGGTRSFTLVYQVETSSSGTSTSGSGTSPRCIGS